MTTSAKKTRAAVEPKRPVGRPTKYEPRFCAMLIEDMKAGFSATAFAGSIGVARSTLSEWADANPEFSVALNTGKAVRLRFWEQTAINVAAKGTGGPGAASVITFGLKNMGDGEWADTTKTEHLGKVEVVASAPDLAKLPLERLRDLAEILKEASADPDATADA